MNNSHSENRKSLRNPSNNCTISTQPLSPLALSYFNMCRNCYWHYCHHHCYCQHSHNMPRVESHGVSHFLTTSTRTSWCNNTCQNLNFSGQHYACLQGTTMVTLDVNGSYLLIVNYVHVLHFQTGLDNDS
jgi:hypothetical protein